ncbi:hypothetical protein VNO80_19395 [Phaseolus coccineus]|uniref:Uncharacterized protein n=1 Tax=Phaseolus coccineus TaxID=3886 RepID=A0AAN9MG28_PHACN
MESGNGFSFHLKRRTSVRLLGQLCFVRFKLMLGQSGYLQLYSDAQVSATVSETTKALRAAVATTEEYKEKIRHNQEVAEGIQDVLRAELAKFGVEKDQLMREKAEGVRQVAFYHGVPIDDSRYDISMDVIDGKLVPLSEGVDTMMEENKEEDEMTK